MAVKNGLAVVADIDGERRSVIVMDGAKAIPSPPDFLRAAESYGEFLGRHDGPPPTTVSGLMASLSRSADLNLILELREGRQANIFIDGVLPSAGWR